MVLDMPQVHGAMSPVNCTTNCASLVALHAQEGLILRIRAQQLDATWDSWPVGKALIHGTLKSLIHTGWAPPVISGFINHYKPYNYSYIYHKATYKAT